MITETRKKIIELINPFMDKTLSQGCLIIHENCICKLLNKTDFGDYRVIKQLNLISYDKILKEEDKFEIIGHYDITAVLKYISSFYKGTIVLDDEGYFIEINRKEFKYNYLMLNDKNIKIPLKPLHLYTEQELENLYEILYELLKQLGLK